MFDCIEIRDDVVGVEIGTTKVERDFELRVGPGVMIATAVVDAVIRAA